MVSSIGVVPIPERYGSNVQVNKVLFFGAALQNKTQPPSQAIGTMIHAITFRDELQCMLNFTSPGIAKSFMEQTAQQIQHTLLAMANL